MPRAQPVLYDWAKWSLLSFGESQVGLVVNVLHHQRPGLPRGLGRREGIQSEDVEGTVPCALSRILNTGPTFDETQWGRRLLFMEKILR